MMDIFLYLDRRTWVHRLDPRTKLLALLAVLLVSVAIDHPLYQIGILAGILLVVASASAWPSLRRVRFLIFTVGVFSAVAWSFFAHGRTRLIGPVELEAFLFGLGTGLKLINMIVTSVVFLSTTRNEEISAALIRFGLPFPVAFAFSTALRLVPTFIGAGATIIQAQRSRGLDAEAGNIFQRLRKQTPLLIPVFASAIRSTNNLSMALESKGFGARKKRTYYLELAMGSLDVIVVAFSVGALILAIWLKIKGFGIIPGLL